MADCDFVHFYEDGTKLYDVLFLSVSSYYICTKSMNNFKTHKLLKKKRPEIFYVFYSRCLICTYSIGSKGAPDQNAGVYGFYLWNSSFKPKSYWLITYESEPLKLN